MSFCTNCGNQLHGEKFCTKCGARVTETPQNPGSGPGMAQGVGAGPVMSVKPRRGRLPIVILCLLVCAVAAAAIALGVNLAGGNALLGQWELANEASAPFDELEFFSDGTYASDDANYNGQYSAEDGRIMFEGILVSPINCAYELGKNTLTITYEDEVWEFQRTPDTSAPSGSNEKAKKKLQGQWSFAGDVSVPFDELEFFNDGSYASDDANYNGRYSIDGDRIKFEGMLVSPIVCSFELDGDTLTLIYEEDEIWEFHKNE